MVNGRYIYHNDSGTRTLLWDSSQWSIQNSANIPPTKNYYQGLGIAESTSFNRYTPTPDLSLWAKFEVQRTEGTFYIDPRSKPIYKMNYIIDQNGIFGSWIEDSTSSNSDLHFFGQIDYRLQLIRGVYFTNDSSKMNGFWVARKNEAAKDRLEIKLGGEIHPNKYTFEYHPTAGKLFTWEPTEFSREGINAKACSACWDDSDMTPYSTWDGRGSYSEQEVTDRSPQNSFILEHQSSKCVLQCGLGFWSNYNSQFNKAANEYDQRCTSFNCKDWQWKKSNS
jgi:hypothetical protein